jgi:hypothetical protein
MLAIVDSIMMRAAVIKDRQRWEVRMITRDGDDRRRSEDTKSFSQLYEQASQLDLAVVLIKLLPKQTEASKTEVFMIFLEPAVCPRKLAEAFGLGTFQTKAHGTSVAASRLLGGVVGTAG